MAPRYTYATCLSWGGDTPTAEIDVEVSYTVAWGSPETGRFGVPEDYDPGSPDVVEDLRVEKIDGRPVEDSPGLLVPIMEKLEAVEDELFPDLIIHAREVEEARADEAADYRKTWFSDVCLFDTEGE